MNAELTREIFQRLGHLRVEAEVTSSTEVPNVQPVLKCKEKMNKCHCFYSNRFVKAMVYAWAGISILNISSHECRKKLQKEYDIDWTIAPMTIKFSVSQLN